MLPGSRHVYALSGEAQQTPAYLARYIFKTATANRPLSFLPDGRVPWPDKDNATGKLLAVKLHPDELIRRFVQHLLPQGYFRSL